MTKRELRLQLRTLPALPPDVRQQRSGAICEAIVGTAAWRSARVVGLFAGAGHEPDLSALWEHRESRTFVFPRVDGEGLENERLIFYRIDSPDQLIASRWGLFEPAADTEAMAPAEIDLVLVPGVAFTPDGQRMGRGRGHYDRFLPKLRADAVTLGIVFSERVLPDLPTEAHDVPLSGIISS
jgi:5-formyltetrahydrofolate cyclo-ligase